MARCTVDFKESKGIIDPKLYGHMAEHIGGVFYDGLWVGEDSPVPNVRGFRSALVDSFKKLNPPVLRWPGGCFAETYDWRDGIGPREGRPTRVNWWYSRDGRTEPNLVGSHEFMDLCHMVGAEPYIAANMTSVTPLHIRDWVEYMNLPRGATTLTKEREKNGDAEPFGVAFWGIGNENWGGGGQMTPEMCGREFIRYSTVVNSLQQNQLRFILCGANGDDVEWTRRLMAAWADRKFHEAPTYGVSIHYYCGTAGDPQTFTSDEWYRQLAQADHMRAIIDMHRATMDEYDPERRLALVVDEWGCWHRDGTGPSEGGNLFEQQSSMRDAVAAAMTLNIFNNRCDVVKMANVAQLVNNLHSLYLAAGDQFVETPNYFVFDMFKSHMNGRQLRVHCGLDESAAGLARLSVSASERDGLLTMTLANTSLKQPAVITLHGEGGTIAGRAELTELHSSDPHCCNTFTNPRAVAPRTWTADLHDGDELAIPPAGILAVRVRRR